MSPVTNSTSNTINRRETIVRIPCNFGVVEKRVGVRVTINLNIDGCPNQRLAFEDHFEPAMLLFARYHRIYSMPGMSEKLKLHITVCKIHKHACVYIKF